MPSYAAVLGRQPEISLAELAAAVPDFTLREVVQRQLVIFESQQELGMEFINYLGGTLFLAKGVISGSMNTQDVPVLLHNELQQTKRGKVTFSLRTVGLSPKEVRNLYRTCKDYFKKNGRPCRYVGNERKPVQAVVLHENKMLDGKLGCELLVVRRESKDIWIGKTIGAQNVDAYSKRDMEKPVRDTTVGLLPPKLAQILLNLGIWATQQNKKPKALPKKWKQPTLHVFDPFCGTGVIPLECLLRGWSVTASDISQKAVTGCTKNIDWIRKEENILKKDAGSDVSKHDARKPFELKNKPDVIVTETSLGPNLTKKPTLKDINAAKKDIEALEADFLRNAAETLPGVPIVATFPVWHSVKGNVFLEKVWNTAEEAGYKALLPDVLGTQEKPTMLYRRPGQFVGREIVVFVPQK